MNNKPLNQSTCHHSGQFPHSNDWRSSNLDTLRNRKYFTTLDLKDGFHHIPVDESSVKYTSFVTPLGQFEFVKMPFGLTNAPRLFQRYLNYVFCDLIRQNKILLYLDDILIATETLIEHYDILREVLTLCRSHNLELSLDKCSFLFTSTVYLGYANDENEIRPTQDSVEAIINYLVPRNQKEMYRFLGLASYFRKFVKDFSVIAKPLYALIEKDAVFHIDKAETHLYCDASCSGYGAILCQKQDDGKFRPVIYYSKRTTPTESNYHNCELWVFGYCLRH